MSDKTCAMLDPVEIARLSASAGITAEEACSNVAAAAVKLSAAAESPIPWCSCDYLRRAEAERDRYRSKALDYACNLRYDQGCNCERERGDFCMSVIEEVDGV